jgi:hypothetical protein
MSLKTLTAFAFVALSLSGGMQAETQPVLACGGADFLRVSTGMTAFGYGDDAGDAQDAALAALKVLLIADWGGQPQCVPVCPPEKPKPCSPEIQVTFQAGTQLTTPGVKISSNPDVWQSTASVAAHSEVALGCRQCRD